MKDPKIGEMAWLDMSVANAEQVKGFYEEVIGWRSQAVSMGDYNDYTMLLSDSDTAVAGVCHAQGVNNDLPPAWLPYFLVADIEKSAAQVIQSGGEMVTPVKSVGKDKYAVIKDPAGVVCAIYQKA